MALNEDWNGALARLLGFAYYCDVSLVGVWSTLSDEMPADSCWSDGA
jgi:hypothetical protein